MTPDARATSSLAGITAGAIICASAAASILVLAALTVSLTGLASETRRTLGFGFSGVERSPTEVARITLHNGRVAGATLLCAVLAPRLDPRARRLVDLVLAVVLVFNAAAVGVAIGAYGTRAIAATAPHAPVEFSALALAGGAYMQARKRPLSARALTALALASAALLVAAAALETYGSIGASR